MRAESQMRSVCGLRPAVAPPEAFGRRRDTARLLVTRPDRDDEVAFTALPGLLDAGDVVVLNTSGTRRAAIDIDGTALTLHVSSRSPDGGWIVEFRSAGGRTPHRGPVPATLRVAGAEVSVTGPHNADLPTRLWRARTDADLIALLARHGRFVRYDYVSSETREHWYQNVYAGTPGSAEPVSAGRPFSRQVLFDLRQRGIEIAELVLHCGVSSQEAGEAPHEEYYAVPEQTIDVVLTARERGRRVVAIGTTVVRALETVARTSALSGWTSLLLGDDVRPKVVNAVLSGFHPPEASHLSLLAAFADASIIRRAYEAACAGAFHSHEFGDSHLLLADS